MRRLMIEKIAGHIAEFSPRLQSNTRATYQVCVCVGAILLGVCAVV